MKSSSKLAFTSLLFICLGTSLDANPIPKSSCVELSPDAQEFVSFVTNQMIVGTSAYLVAHLERFEDPISGRLTSGAPSKGSVLFKTSTGSLQVHMVDLLPEIGWAGPRP